MPLLDLLDGKKRRRPYGPARAPAPKEHVLHFATADLLRRLCRPSWRWSHFPSGELRDERTGAKLRRMGLNPGWPDMVLVSPDGRLHCLELKRLGGRLSPDQKAFAGWCAEHGVPHVTAASMTTVAAALNAWGCLRMPIHA